MFFNLQKICHTNVIKPKLDVNYSHKTFWNVLTLENYIFISYKIIKTEVFIKKTGGVEV
jgi:hypothetical protein